MLFRDMQKECYEVAKIKGFHEGDPPSDQCFKDVDRVARWLMLVVTELAEAMEAVRHNDFANFEEEMADAVIRIMDTCQTMGIDLCSAIEEKQKINKIRSHKHGGKRC